MNFCFRAKSNTTIMPLFVTRKNDYVVDITKE